MADSVRQLRRTYRGEEEWFALFQEHEPFEVRAGFIAAGVSPTLAGQLVWFLLEQQSLDRHLTDKSRVKYRRILADLDLDSVNSAIPR
jgi:hypothetical protein